MALSRRITRLTRRRGFSLVVGIGVLIVFAGALVFAANATNGLPFAARTIVEASFTEIGSLREGDDVRIASARVGTVERVGVGDDRAEVTLRIDGDRTIYRNATASTASVGARSALGQKFVDLNPGTPDSGEIRPGDIVPQTETRGAEELGDLFAVFDAPTRAGLQSTLRETGGGLAGRQEDLRDLLSTAPEFLPALGTVSRVLAADDGRDLTRLLGAADNLSSRFAGREEQISGLLTELRTTLDAFAVDETQPVREALDRAPAALRDVRGALDTLNGPLADTESAMVALRPGGQALAAATPDLRGVLREAVGPLDRVPDVADLAEPALGDLTGLSDDLRPLTPRLVQTLDYAATPLQVLAPYSPEIQDFFTNITSALSNSDASGHWLRIMPILGSESVTGVGPAPIEDPTVYRNPYPAPGQAEQDRRPFPITGERN